jgi:transposase InsO family protein
MPWCYGSLYFHSDRGSQYRSQGAREPLRGIGANLSMSGVGNCYENEFVTYCTS